VNGEQRIEIDMTFLFRTADILEQTRRYYESYCSVLLYVEWLRPLGNCAGIAVEFFFAIQISVSFLVIGRVKFNLLIVTLLLEVLAAVTLIIRERNVCLLGVLQGTVLKLRERNI